MLAAPELGSFEVELGDSGQRRSVSGALRQIVPEGVRVQTVLVGRRVLRVELIDGG